LAIGKVVRNLYMRSGVRDHVPMDTKVRLRRRWVRLARRAGRPISSPQLPRPPLARTRKPLRLTHALLACDLNSHYLDSWPLVRRAWLEVANMEPRLVLIAKEDEAPSALLADERVRVFQPIEGVATALQAQCIRLLYPALVEGAEGVLISDMELVPLDPDYFHGPPALLDERFFVSYRDDPFLARTEIAIPYNAAHPETWAEIFRVDGTERMRETLEEWTAPVRFDGVRGGDGWFTDQRTLFRYVFDWPEHAQRLWMLDDDYTGYRRLERWTVEEDGIAPDLRRELLARRYTDYNSLVPHRQFRELNERVLALALESIR
jgi:hypothetical protein